MSFKIIKIKKRGLSYNLRKYLKNKFKKKKTHKTLITALVVCFVVIGGLNAFYKYNFENFISNQFPIIYQQMNLDIRTF